MSKRTGRPDAGGGPPRAAFALRCLAAIAYPLLAHAATLAGDGRLAGFAALDLVLVALAAPLLQFRTAAWATFAAAAFAAAWLARTPHALLPLLLAPPAFVAVVGWAFARTLRGGRVPLVGRIAAALDGAEWHAMPAPLRAYTRRVTCAWALLLCALALVDAAMALLAFPGGVLAQLGRAPAFAIAESDWSWFANIGDYAVIGGFMLLEYGYRRRRFPAQAPGLLVFLRRMARLGPSFWREALR